MAKETAEAPRAGKEDGKSGESNKAAESKEAPAAASGFKAWLPLVVAMVTMPALAFATTHFVILPKLEHAIAKGTNSESGASAASEDGKGEGKTGAEKTKTTVSLTKLLVNVAGTMGTRYLMTSITLVGNKPDFKDKVDDSKEQLTDLATGILGSKTISDLEKPGARNLIRAELTTVFNNALGGPQVQEIYITEMAIQ